MAKLRLRHPKGAVTIDIDLESATVQDLQQKIREQTNVLPSQQDCASLSASRLSLNSIESSRESLSHISFMA